MSSKKNPKSIKRDRRKSATPPESEKDDSGDGDDLKYTEAQARTLFGSPKKEKAGRIQVNITPGNGVYIWMRKGDGPKCGLTKEALKLWNAPIKIKLQDKNALVNYPSLIGECLKPQLSSLLGIDDTPEGWLSVDNDRFIARVGLAIEPSTDYESLLSNLKLENYFGQARDKLFKKAPYLKKVGVDPALYDRDYKLPVVLFDLLTGDFLQLAKEDKDKNLIPVTERKLVETLILSCEFSEIISQAVRSNRTDDLSSTVRQTRAVLQKKESCMTVAGAEMFGVPDTPTRVEPTSAPPNLVLNNLESLGALFNMFRSGTNPTQFSTPTIGGQIKKLSCTICGWENHVSTSCLRKDWPGANLTGQPFPEGKQRLTLEHCFPDETVRKRKRDEERTAIRSIKKPKAAGPAPAASRLPPSISPNDVLAFMNSLTTMPSYQPVNEENYLARGLAVRYTAIGGLPTPALWDNGANISYIDPAVAERISESSKGTIVQLTEFVPVTQGAFKTTGFNSVLFCDAFLVHRGIQHDLPRQLFAIYRTGHPAVIGSDILEAKTKIVDIKTPGPKDDVLISQLCGIFEDHRKIFKPDPVAVWARSTTVGSMPSTMVMPGYIIAIDEKKKRIPTANETFLLTALTAVYEDAQLKEVDRMGWYPGDKLGSMSNDAAVMSFTELHPLPFDGDFTEPAKFEDFSILLEKDVQLKSVFTQKYTPAMMSEMYRQLQELIRLKVITKCDTMPKFLSPVIMVMQKNKIRMCINYKALNSLCRSRAYCMPDLHSHIDDLKGFKFYASFDLMKCYNQFGIKENDRSYAAFSTPFGNFMPTRVQFGFQGAPAYVQSMLSEALRNFPGCEDFRLFIDDAAVGANSMEELYVKIDAFLRFCTFYNLKLQKDKLQIGVRALKYLGVVVCEHGKYLDPSRIQALQEIRRPRSVREVKQLLGAFNWVRLWMPSTATICKPLYKMTEGYAKKKSLDKSTFVWTDDHERAFCQLKTLAATAPILAKLDYDQRIYVRTDASQWGMGGVIFQLDKRTGRPVPVGYFSRCFTPQEQKYSVPDQEMMAIKETIEKFEHMLLGHQFTVQTDALNLRSMFNSEVSRIVRSRLAITRHMFDIQHICGEKENEVCDGISRLHEPYRNENISQVEGKISPDGAAFSVASGTSDEEELRAVSIGVYQQAPNSSYIGSYITPMESYSDMTNPEFLELSAEWHECATATLNEFAMSLRSHPQRGAIRPSVMDLVTSVEDAGKVSSIIQDAKAIEDALGPSVDDIYGVPPIIQDAKAIKNALGPSVDDIYGPPPIIQDASTRESALGPSVYDVYGDPSIIQEAVAIGIDVVSGSSATKAITCRTIETQTEPEDFIPRLPIQACETVFNDVHSSTSGHWGESETFRRMLARKPDLDYSQTRRECSRLVQACKICQKIRGLDSKVKTRFSHINKHPWEEISIDTLTFSSPDADFCRYMVVIVDSFTRYTEMFPVKDTTAETIVQCLLRIYSRYGSPTTIRCDGGPQFRSDLIKQFHSLTQVKILQVIPYHPQANGKVEARQGQIMRHLRAMVLSDTLGPNTGFSWSRLVPFVFKILNNSVHSAIGCTPTALLYGIHGMSGDNLLPISNFEGTTFEYLKIHQEHQLKLLKLSEDHQAKELITIARSQGTSKPREILEGEFVLLRSNVVGKTTKLNCKWYGPYVVVDRTDSEAPLCLILDLSTRRVREAHMQDLRAFDMSRTTMLEAQELAATDVFEYKVEKIIDHRCDTTLKGKKSDYWFLVKWEACDESTWEPYENLKFNVYLKEYVQKKQIKMFFEQGPKL